jgi:DnaJ-class molecular chaperone
MAYTIHTTTATAASIYGAGTLQEAETTAARVRAFYREGGHINIASLITQDCAECGGSGSVRSRRQACWVPGKTCKACKGAGGFPV